MENQEIGLANTQNPLLNTQEPKSENTKTKKSDKRLFYIGGLLAALFFLTILSIVVSIVNRPKVKLVTQEVTPTPTPLIQINNPELPKVWQEKFKTVNDNLDTITNLQGKDEFLPPVFDLDLGKN